VELEVNIEEQWKPSTSLP